MPQLMKSAGLAPTVFILAGAALSASSATAAPQAAVAQSADAQLRIDQPDSRASHDAALEERLARDWGLRREEWARYRQLMRGPLGIYSPTIDPLTALGIEARTNEERTHYADLQVRMEARRAKKLLDYQRAYDTAWKRAYPALRPIEPASAPVPNIAHAPRTDDSDGRIAVFVKDDCAPCTQRVKQLQASGSAFDLYLVGSHHEDARIRSWAAQVGIDPAKVRTRTITLNHDDGRWLSIDGHGELPAVLKLIDGQWQRM